MSNPVLSAWSILARKTHQWGSNKTDSKLLWRWRCIAANPLVCTVGSVTFNFRNKDHENTLFLFLRLIVSATAVHSAIRSIAWQQSFMIRTGLSKDLTDFGSICSAALSTTKIEGLTNPMKNSQVTKTYLLINAQVFFEGSKDRDLP